jgi:uncharacterized protein (DUF4415 family)
MGRQKPERRLKTRIAIRIDTDLVDHFRKEAAQTVHSEHPAGYQTLINEALRQYIETEAYLERVTREELYKFV